MTKYHLTSLFMMNENKTIPELLERFLQYAEVMRNYAPATLSGYRSTFKLFLIESGCLFPDDLSKHKIEEWFFNGRLKRKWSPVTFRSHHKYLNVFFKWLIKEEIITNNPLEGLEKPRIEHKLPRTLSRPEAMLVLDAAYHMKYAYTFERYRNRAIIGIMVLAGLRKGEVLALKMNHVNLIERKIFISQGKGHKDRIVPINRQLYTILTEYLKDRNRLDKKNLHFFVSIQKDNKIEKRCIDNIVSKIRKYTKINFSAHTLRHAFARLMLEGGVDIYTLSKIMGHSRITTTTIYLQCSNQQMDKAIEMHSLN